MIQIEVLRGPAKGKIIEVSFDDETGALNDENSVIWGKILNISGGQGAWSVSFKDSGFTDGFDSVYKIL